MTVNIRGSTRGSAGAMSEKVSQAVLQAISQVISEIVPFGTIRDDIRGSITNRISASPRPSLGWRCEVLMTSDTV